MLLWRLTSPRPAGRKFEPRKSWWCSGVWVRPENQENWGCEFQSKFEGRRRQSASSRTGRQGERGFSFTQPFCSLQASSRWGEAHPHGERGSVFLSLMIWVQIWFRNTLAATPRNMFDRVSGHLVALVKGATINHHGPPLFQPYCSVVF